LGAEILATAAEEMRLVAPPRRVTRPDGAIVGAAPELDAALQPTREQLATAIARVMKTGW
jgi:pyruvate dehydrogenase E1 component beta subunit